MADDKIVSVMGLKVDRTLTLGNLIQIVLLVSVIIGGTFAFYYGVQGRLQEIATRQDDTTKTVDRNMDTYFQRIGAADGRFVQLESRMSQVETKQATYDANLEAIVKHNDAVATKLDALDNFLRSYLVDRSGGSTR